MEQTYGQSASRAIFLIGKFTFAYIFICLNINFHFVKIHFGSLYTKVVPLVVKLLYYVRVLIKITKLIHDKLHFKM